MSDLSEAVSALRREAGNPALRRISARCNREITHTTVSNVLSGRRTVRWSSVVQVVRALGGNPDDFRQLWEVEYDAFEERRQQRAGRSRPKVVAGTVVRPGDKILFTYPEDRDDIESIHEQLTEMFPDQQVVLVAGTTATVVRREEAA